jgi:predicted ATP-grasp superfamily ATP-dependent carboligase
MQASKEVLRMFGDTSTPVLLLGCFRHSGLGIVRSLGRLGVPVYVIESDRFSVGLFSKYCGGKFIWDPAVASPDESLNFLADVGRKIGRRSVLIANSDSQAMFVADYADRLVEYFIFPEPSADLVRSLCSKKEMYHLARKCGVSTPETTFPQSRDDVLQYLKSAQFPILLKPIFSQINGNFAKPMVLAHTERELLEIYDATEDPSQPNLMLQEFIPGGDDMTWTFNGYFDRNSECRIAFTGKKLRNFPPGFGMASLAVCLGNEEVEKTTISFMKAIGYKGGLDLGYRYDSRDGRYKVNDVNPRVGAMLRVFVGNNGMDVVRALYLDMTKQPVIASVGRDGRKWIVEDHDLRSSLFYYRSGQLSIADWVRSLRGVKETAYFARDDLRPFGAMLMRNAKAAFRRSTRSRSKRPAMAVPQPSVGCQSPIGTAVKNG